MSHVHHVRQGKSNDSGMHLCGGDDVLRWVHAITHAARASTADAAVTTGAWSTCVSLAYIRQREEHDPKYPTSTITAVQSQLCAAPTLQQSALPDTCPCALRCVNAAIGPKCLAKLKADCAPEQKLGKTACNMCIMSDTANLTAAGCTSADETTYCAGAGPVTN